MTEAKTEQRMIKISSSDNETFTVPREVIRLSTTINTLLPDLGLDDDDSSVNTPIPVQNVSTPILKKVISWCQYHYQDTAQDNRETDDIASWDAEFIKVDQRTLFDLVMAAKYLEIMGLLDVTCKAVANMIKGKSPEELCRTFNIKNDFSPEEAEQIRKWNAWCKD